MIDRETTMAIPQPSTPADEPAELRRELRQRVLLSGKIVHSPGEMSVDCAIQDISSAGARVRLSSSDGLGDPIYLINMSHGMAFKARVAWRRENRVGLAFTQYWDLAKTDPDRPPILRRLYLEHVR
jgi:hypothetical protein